MDDLNVIIVVMDSLRQDHVSFYNEGRRIFDRVPAARTPNIDRFALDSAVFRRLYPSGLPTIPQRTELITGRFTLPYKGWSPLNPDDLPISATMKRQGYVTALISDTYHMFKPGYNFYSYMDFWEFVRGQEYDPHGIPPPRNRRVEDYSNEIMRKDPAYVGLLSKFLSNIDDFSDDREDDWFPARVFSHASRWLLEHHKKGKFFLWVDSFDPHEPWEHPHGYDKEYRDPEARPRLILPKGGMATSWANQDEIDDIRSLYAGEVTFVDASFGKFYDTLRELGLLDNSVIVLLADHGHPLADHGKFLKGGDRLYGELLSIPFMISLPKDIKAELGIRHRVEGLATVADVLPTIFDLLSLRQEAVQLAGRSLLPLMTGESEGRDYVIAGYHEAPDRAVMTRNYRFISRPEGQSDELYDLSTDPRETHNLVDELPEVAKSMARYLVGTWGFGRQTYVKGLQGKYELMREVRGMLEVESGQFLISPWVWRKGLRLNDLYNFKVSSLSARTALEHRARFDTQSLEMTKTSYAPNSYGQ